jgi:hypothetical protein
MDVCAPLIAHLQPPEAAQPRQRALHHPAIAPQPLAGLDPLAGDTRRDASAATRPPIPGGVLRFVGMQLLWPLAGPSPSAPHRRDGIQGRGKHLAVVPIGCPAPHRQRKSAAFDHHLALPARFAALRRPGAARFAPPGADTLAASSEARSQSNRPTSLSRWSKVWCSRSHTPACCQSPSPRQQVIPLATAQFLGQHLPGDAALEDKDTARQDRSIGQVWPSPFGFGWLWWQEWFNDHPPFISDQGLPHTSSLSYETKVL